MKKEIDKTNLDFAGEGLVVLFVLLLVFGFIAFILWLAL